MDAHLGFLNNFVGQNLTACQLFWVKYILTFVYHLAEQQHECISSISLKYVVGVAGTIYGFLTVFTITLDAWSVGT